MTRPVSTPADVSVPMEGARRPTLASVALMLLVGCCLCASLAASLI